MLLYPKSFPSFMINTNCIRRCHLFVLECGGFGTSRLKKFLPNPAQALGDWGRSTVGIAFRLLSEVFLPASTTTQFLL